MRYKNIIFDFDGVLVKSNEIRFMGFQMLFNDYPIEEVRLLVEYCKNNSGTSRYDKIRHFFEIVRNESVTDKEINYIAKQYSELIKQYVIKAEPVMGAVEFLYKYHKIHNLAVVSGSDQEELREICALRKISSLFIDILGSPESKEKNILNLISKMEWDKEDCIYVGDSINDYKAARINGIDFLALDSGMTNWKKITSISIIKDINDLAKYLFEK